MPRAVWSIAAGLAGVVLCGLSSAEAADGDVRALSRLSPVEPVVQAVAVAPARAPQQHARPAPPELLARTVVPVNPVMAVRPIPASAVVAQGNVVRIVTPSASEPGVLWLTAMGAVLCRIGARVLRVSWPVR
ncbi:MAG TPA: hypothetical protein VGR35_18785 [Tepidisphaeraceae bacterium]|nr:hypothetical protein [Tepidisphaeraceae bacterium]